MQDAAAADWPRKCTGIPKVSWTGWGSGTPVMVSLRDKVSKKKNAGQLSREEAKAMRKQLWGLGGKNYKI